PPGSSRKWPGAMRSAWLAAYRAVPSAVAEPAITVVLAPSALTIEQQDQSDRGEAPAPDPSGCAARGRQPHLEPSAPPREGAENAERRVRDLAEELVLEIEHRVRVREQQPAADRAQQREHKAPRALRQPLRAHHPLEDGEGDHEQDERAVLQHVGQRQALPESCGAQRPGTRVVADEEKRRESQEQEGPVTRHSYRSEEHTSELQSLAYL